MLLKRYDLQRLEPPSPDYAAEGCIGDLEVRLFDQCELQCLELPPPITLSTAESVELDLCVDWSSGTAKILDA